MVDRLSTIRQIIIPSFVITSTIISKILTFFNPWMDSGKIGIILIYEETCMSQEIITNLQSYIASELLKNQDLKSNLKSEI